MATIKASDLDPDIPVSPELRADPDASAQWVLLLYGATMQQVQGFEFALRWLYLVANVDPEKVSNASLKRQWYNTFTKVSRAFQAGSAGMRLKDRDKGLKQHIPESLYNEIDTFIQRRRNPLAHNFLIQHLSEDGTRYARGTILELLEAVIEAGKLTKQMQACADQIRQRWPNQPDPPAEVIEMAEMIGRMAMLRRFPPSIRPS